MTQSVIIEQHHGETCSAEDEPTRLVEEVFSKNLRVGERLATGAKSGNGSSNDGSRRCTQTSSSKSGRSSSC